MQITKIPKKKRGEFRTICVPSAEEKTVFHRHLPQLNEKAAKILESCVHGFVPGKSCVTNAMMHRGYSYSLSFDLLNFFDSVQIKHVEKKLSLVEISELMPDGRAYQGLPTSPQIANIAAADMDRAILRKIAGRGIIYSRYADDLVMSYNDFNNTEFLKLTIPEIVGRCGFKINKNKTRLQDARFGRREITGVYVDSDIHVSRNVKRRLRAAKHRGNTNQAAGLSEWSKLKLPNPENTKLQKELDRVCNFWRLKKLKIKELPVKQNSKLSKDVFVSGDPVQILGLSDWTTNWRSCMKHNKAKSENAKGAIFYAIVPNVRIAYIDSGEKLTVNGVVRPKMQARALIFDCDSGESFYKGIYGEDEEMKNRLQTVLNNNKIYSIGSGRLVSDKINYKGPFPYSDSMIFSHNKISG